MLGSDGLLPTPHFPRSLSRWRGKLTAAMVFLEPLSLSLIIDRERQTVSGKSALQHFLSHVTRVCVLYLLRAPRALSNHHVDKSVRILSTKMCTLNSKAYIEKKYSVACVVGLHPARAAVERWVGLSNPFF